MPHTDHTNDTLLIVDDDANIRAALSRLFRRDGYHLLSAGSGDEALALLACHEVGVIIADQRMPGMSGAQFLGKVREQYPDCVRIMLSGYTDLSSVTDSVNQGAIYKFLTKPWEDAELRETVGAAFRLYRVTRENTRLNHELQQANEALTHWNLELEQRVADKTREALRNLHVLRVSQEILAHLPLAVLGIDSDGTIVMVNRAAEMLLDDASSLLGEPASAVLPESFLTTAAEVDGDLIQPGLGQLEDGRRVGYWRYPLSIASIDIGMALVLQPSERETLQ